MKKISSYLCFVAVFAMLFASCSKEDDPVMKDSGNKATLSFGAILNDLVANKSALKQQIENAPECSDAAPAFVEVVLTGTANVGTMQDPVVVSVNPNPGDYDQDGVAEFFTDESGDLELEPGSYNLEYFAVYDADPASGGNLIWMAPRSDGNFADFVSNALPFNFDLGAGVKKYVDVDVLCYDNRMANQYGYLFFDFEGTQAIEFCIFGNYCPPSGRHFPAAFSVDVWMYEDGARGEQLYDDLSNSVALNEDGDYAGDPLCIALPDRSGEDEYYFEITMQNSDAYDDVEERIIRRGVITDEEVRSFFDGDNNIDYYHFREGCGDDSPPIFQDPEEDAEHYKACLYPQNGSTALGFAYFKLQGETLEATVMATNLEGGQAHAQHIHENEDCNDAGGPILGLDEEDGSWPVASTAYGDVVYHRTFTLGSGDLPSVSEINPLQDRTVNLHGMTVDGSYNAGIVVSCGELSVLNFD